MHIKALFTFTLFLILMGCSHPKEQADKGEVQESIELDGYWRLSAGQYVGNKSSEQIGCPIPDARLEDLYTPDALGDHILINGDSVWVFRYPYQYLGKYQYEIEGDSMLIPGYSIAPVSFIESSDKSKFQLKFDEAFNSSCILSAEAEYTSFAPNEEVINKLIQDSISCDSIVEKWWYLRKDISYEDGSEPLFLNYPKGVLDSIFISPDMKGINDRKPYLEFEVGGRTVKMLYSVPGKNSFTLVPELDTDRELLNCVVVVGEYLYTDTAYYDLIYYSY